MIVHSPDNFLIHSESICFVRRYRCQECGRIALGQEQDQAAMTCEHCDAELHADDEVALRVSEDQ